MGRCVPMWAVPSYETTNPICRAAMGFVKQSSSQSQSNGLWLWLARSLRAKRTHILFSSFFFFFFFFF